ncbi:MAG TPA: hydrogenase maturation protease [Solirubrobacteraceae bacterium]|nr:hydrogenase maturation protease [Solirubrobacteraceae bacterium]
MSDPVRQIADAVLYEGYLLWPYRRSALKNQKPFGWGDLDPDEKPLMRAQCLLEGADPVAVEVSARFLEMVGDEGVEREVGPGQFAFPPLAGELTVVVEGLAPDVHRLTVELVCRAGRFRAAHALLRTSAGAFVSLTDPPDRLREAAEACHNVGVWPILVGEPGSTDTMLCSPIILEDHPRIAPESPGDLYDGGEIDGLLRLSIMSLTDDEKAEIRAGDPRAGAILERTESLTEDELLALYGFRQERPAPDAVVVDGVELRRRSRVRLKPRRRADIFDVALAGRTAMIESIEHDTDGNVQFAVTMDDDPGRDLGERRQPGHRFFFRTEEVEPLAETVTTRILVAGIGNLFLGDDGFGVALAARLARREQRPGVEVVDFGIRGMDLAYALGGYDIALLLDATPRGEPPGTLYVIEPELSGDDVVPEAHGMDPVKVLALARALGETLPRTLVVGCEPQTRMSADDEEIVAALSEPVRAALDEAERLVESLLDDLMKGEAQ